MLKKLQKKLDSTDKFLVLRGILILMVIIYHSMPPFKFLKLGGADLTWPYFANGRLAVFSFFLLSGYLMGKMFFIGKYKLNWSGIKDFWRKRAVRILPLYYFALLIYILFVYTHLQRPENWVYFLRIATFNYDGDPVYHFNNAWWAVSTEIQFYLLSPFVAFFFFKKLKKKKFILLLSLLLALTYGIFLRRYFFTAAQTEANKWAFTLIKIPLIQNFDVFLSGFLIYPIVKQFKLVKKAVKYRNLSVLFFVLVYLVASFFLYREPVRGSLENLIYLIFLPTYTIMAVGLIVFLFDIKQPIGSNAGSLGFINLLKNPLKTGEFLGLISFGIFLWHMTILQTMGSLIVYDGRLYLYFAKTLLTIFWSIVLATITYYFIEKPFHSVKKQA